MLKYIEPKLFSLYKMEMLEDGEQYRDYITCTCITIHNLFGYVEKSKSWRVAGFRGIQSQSPETERYHEVISE
jgi:hypothetical protein